MKFLLAIIAAIVLLPAAVQAGDTTQPQYLIHISWTQTAGDGKREIELAAPTITTVENREAFVRVGGEKTIAGETIETGTSLKLRVVSADDETLTIRGKIEVAELFDETDDSATRKSTCVYFKRSVKAGEVSRFKLPAGEAQSVEFRVEKVDAQPTID